MTLLAHGPQAERFQGIETTKVGKPLAAPVQRQQAAFL